MITPTKLIEATNGIVLILFFWMGIFIIHYLRLKYREIYEYGSRTSALRTLYRETKPAIALLFIVLGMVGRTAILLADRSFYSRGLAAPYWFVCSAPISLAIFTGIMMIGLVCWIRVMTPIGRRGSGPLLMILASAAFGLAVAFLH